MPTDIECTLQIADVDHGDDQQMHNINRATGKAEFKAVKVESLIESLKLAPEGMTIPIMNDGTFGFKFVEKRKKIDDATR